MKISHPHVARVFAHYPTNYRKRLKALRKLILEVAHSNPEIGELEETLKWGEPSYLPKQKKIGTTVRIHWLKSKPEQYGIYFNCQTNLVERFKKSFPETFRFEGKRAIIFSEADVVPVPELKSCIRMALTYHLGKA